MDFDRYFISFLYCIRQHLACVPLTVIWCHTTCCVVTMCYKLLNAFLLQTLVVVHGASECLRAYKTAKFGEVFSTAPSLQSFALCR